MLLLAGIAVFWLADSLYLVGNANGTYAPGSLVRRRLVGRHGPDRRGRLAARAARASSFDADERLRRIVVPLAFGADEPRRCSSYGCRRRPQPGRRRARRPPRSSR